MKLHFLGTRGNIRARTDAHRRHSALAISHGNQRAILDCGGDWLHETQGWKADAIVVTHAHPDHVEGLKRGAPCPVFATAESWEIMRRYPLRERVTIHPRRRYSIAGMTFVAFPVEHSLRAPAVGYRVTAGKIAIFYCPDLVSIHDRHSALRGIAAYIGDGATISRSFARRRGDRLIGHAPLEEQLAWCHNSRVPKVLITHCGTQIVTANQAELAARLAELGHRFGLRLEIAHDGLELTLRHRVKRLSRVRR